jgi:hypothetical protein
VAVKPTRIDNDESVGRVLGEGETVTKMGYMKKLKISKSNYSGPAGPYI